MKFPLILISLDDGSVGVYTDSKYILSDIEAIDVDNYRLFDANAFELEIRVIEKRFMYLFLGNKIDIFLDITSSSKDVDFVIDYITKNLLYRNIRILNSKANDLSYLLDLLVNIKGYNRIF